MAQMVYPCSAEIRVKPSIVNIGFLICKSNEDPKQVINELNKTINLVKDYCTSRPSYRKDSYSQSNINVRQDIHKFDVYVNTENNKIIDVTAYLKLSANEQAKYIPQRKEEFLGYIVSTTIEIILNNDDTVIDDFTNIVNMAVENDIKVEYEHNILPEERHTYMKKLYAQCVNQGMRDIVEIVTNIDVFDPKTLKIEEIVENFGRTGALIADKYCSSDLASASYEPEQYFVPEIIKELFNNNIVLSKQLELRVTL